MPIENLITDNFRDAYDSTWRMLAQQKIGKAKEYATMVPFQGKRTRLSMYGETEFEEVITRAQATPDNDTTNQVRWITGTEFHNAQMKDKNDELFLVNLGNPMGPVTQAQKAAWARKCDTVIFSDIAGTNFTGEDGTTPETFPASQEVAVNYVHTGAAADSNLTLAKLIEAKSLFGRNDVDLDEEEIHFFHTQQMLDSLLNNVDQVKSSDYAQVKALHEGKINYFLGMTWHQTQRLPLATGNVRTGLVWCKSGVAFTYGGEITRISERADKSYALQAYAGGIIGATRIDTKKVVALYADEDL